MKKILPILFLSLAFASCKKDTPVTPEEVTVNEDAATFAEISSIDIGDTGAAEITAYLAKPAIAYNPAKGVDQIACQAYLHFFKQPNEAWSLYKRTGYPNATSVLPLERIIVGGAEQQIPRRALLTFPSPTNLNYQNILDAYTEMQKDPDFGTGISDIFGRVWWDKK